MIELIVVMVILGIVASSGTSFIVTSMQNFATVNSQNQLLFESRVSTEYMMRRLRNALPYSIRTLNSEACLQFMPIVSSGAYLELLPSVVNGAPAAGSVTPVQVSPFTVTGGDSDYLVIAANSSAELYGALPGSLAEIASIAATTITLQADKQWLRNSINQRFYIVEEPSVFCIANNELRLYRGVSIADSSVDLTSSYDVVSHSVSALATAFSISSAVEDRNIRITLSLLFSDDDNRLEVVKHVVVRNVP